MQRAFGMKHLGPVSSSAICPMGHQMGPSAVQGPEVSQAWVQLIQHGLGFVSVCAQTHSGTKCTWDHRAGTRLVGWLQAERNRCRSQTSLGRCCCGTQGTRCQTQLSSLTELQRHLPSSPRVWSKDGHRHQQRSWQHRSLGSLFSWTPSFTCGVASKELSPEDPKIIRELRAALGLW